MKRSLFLLCLLTMAVFLVVTAGCEKAKEKAAEKAGEMKEMAAGKMDEMKEKAAGKMDEMKEKVSGTPAAGQEEGSGWSKCKGCHTDAGTPGPSKATLLKKYKTAKELVAAAMKVKNPMMSSYQKDELLEAAAKDLGLK